MKLFGPVWCLLQRGEFFHPVLYCERIARFSGAAIRSAMFSEGMTGELLRPLVDD
jgi:hypothetical protein